MIEIKNIINEKYKVRKMYKWIEKM
jgi:hypothetical protein